MTDQIRFDRVELKADIRADGHIYDTPVLTRVGVFPYRDPAFPGGWRREYRPPEEVFHKDHLDSLLGRPITANHPKGMAHSRSDLAPVLDQHGKPWQSIGAAISTGRQDGNDMRGDVVIHHPDPVIKGAKELSLGYRLRLDMSPGVWKDDQGVDHPYDCIQRDMRVDHIACVPKGRAGNARLNLDADDLDNNDQPQKDPTIMADPKLVTIRLDTGLEYQASPEIQVALSAALAKAAAEATRADAATTATQTLQGKLDGVQAKLDATEANIAKFREDAVEAVKTRMRLEATAKEHGVEVRHDQDDQAVKKLVINKLSPKINLDGKSEGYVDGLFDHLIIDAQERSKNVAGQRQSTTPAPGIRQDNANSSSGGSAAAARDRMISGKQKEA